MTSRLDDSGGNMRQWNEIATSAVLLIIAVISSNACAFRDASLQLDDSSDSNSRLDLPLICNWNGTAPWCAGSCAPPTTFLRGNATDSDDASRLVLAQRDISGDLQDYLLRSFGNVCWNGSKALCCNSPAP
jgi:hypothetical protein